MRTRSTEAQWVVNASARLRKQAERANPELWAKAYAAIAKDNTDPDASFIATMTPEVGLAAADFLDAVTAWDDEHSTGLNWEHQVPARALAIARAVLGGPR